MDGRSRWKRIKADREEEKEEEEEEDKVEEDKVEEDKVVKEEEERVASVVAAFVGGAVLPRDVWASLFRVSAPSSSSSSDQRRGVVARELRACLEHPWSALHLAAMLGDCAAVAAVLAAVPAAVRTRAGCSGRTALVAAVKSGQLATARMLWQAAPPPEELQQQEQREEEQQVEQGGQNTRSRLGGGGGGEEEEEEGGPGQPLPPLKLLSFALRSGNVELVRWLLQTSRRECQFLNEASSEQLFKLVTSVVQLEPDRRGPMILELCGDSETRLSVALACAAARGCEEVLEVLVQKQARLLESEYSQMLVQLPPGTFIEMLKSLLRLCVPGTVSLLAVSKARLLQDAVLAGSPELCSLLLARGCRCEPRSEAERRQPWRDALWLAVLGLPCRHDRDDRVKLGTDHSVRMAEMLLSLGGASPHLRDARGNRLLEALWCGRWWSSSERRAEPHRPRFELEDNRARLGAVLRKWMATWSPARHLDFPEEFRLSAKTVLLCNLRLRRQGSPFLPKDMIHMLLGWMAVADTHSPERLRRALECLKKEQLTNVLEDKGCGVSESESEKEDLEAGTAAGVASASPSPLRHHHQHQHHHQHHQQQQQQHHHHHQQQQRLKRRKTKTELVEKALRRREEDEARTRRQLRTASELPEIIGRLVGREDQTGVTFELNIVNPTRQPWINIGRSFVKHPKGGATLDMDLSTVEFNRRISRLHATIRFNVLEARWEVQIRGRNGLEIDRGTIAGPETCLPSSSWIALPPSLSFRMPFANLSFQILDMVPNVNGALDNEDVTHN